MILHYKGHVKCFPLSSLYVIRHISFEISEQGQIQLYSSPVSNTSPPLRIFPTFCIFFSNASPNCQAQISQSCSPSCQLQPSWLRDSLSLHFINLPNPPSLASRFQLYQASSPSWLRLALFAQQSQWVASLSCAELGPAQPQLVFIYCSFWSRLYCSTWSKIRINHHHPLQTFESVLGIVGVSD